MTILAVILILSGFAVRGMAKRALRQNWSAALLLPPTIVTTGVYRYLRHPSYLGSMMIATGLLILSVHACLVYLTVLFFLQRMIEEEKILLMHPEYWAYREKTGAIVPKVKLWRHG